mgnify:FL=1
MLTKLLTFIQQEGSLFRSLEPRQMSVHFERPAHLPVFGFRMEKKYGKDAMLFRINHQRGTQMEQITVFFGLVNCIYLGRGEEPLRSFAVHR